MQDPGTALEWAAAIDVDVRALPVRNTPSVDRVGRDYHRQLRSHPPAFVIDVALALKESFGHRIGIPYDLVRYREDALARLGEPLVLRFAGTLDSWKTVDYFARDLAGPAWVRGRIGDELVDRWAHSKDRWWRRTALVCTVAWNTPVSGGAGDTERTLDLCRILIDDRDDMVVKAFSWALRSLIAFDRPAVERFLAEHDETLAARVKREVRNKLETGRKNPRKGKT